MDARSVEEGLMKAMDDYIDASFKAQAHVSTMVAACRRGRGEAADKARVWANAEFERQLDALQAYNVLLLQKQHGDGPGEPVLVE